MSRKQKRETLYEAVRSEEAYVDLCLRRYLGRIYKCETVEELHQVRDGVTPDCYSYSNFIFRHSPRKSWIIPVMHVSVPEYPRRS